MARPELGLKRQCMSCGAKFYDLDRDPATCPKCGTVYQATATSRVAAPALAARAADEEDETEDKTGPELVSLDEVEAAEDDAEATTDDDTDAEAETTDGDDDTFLEEEDSGDDDVSDLIDGDIENDEET
ncbi:TIGR02300 family protein [Methylobacterium planeticum]|uniref:TIGR02300 family protein n=1 Tax=Methylobacterium planeticum TaxID=2615211 RepID=A0A6N6MYP1_9HYPH|nr:TIGR02300 family protein [Methylobacterium planeticum]KAB1076203.1 TIGR02300 family protein [Methylobacterium planeticum]